MDHNIEALLKLRSMLDDQPVPKDLKAYLTREQAERLAVDCGVSLEDVLMVDQLVVVDGDC